MFLHSWKNDGPELGSDLQFANGDVLESVANLGVGEILGVILENESIIWDVVGALESTIDLMENVTWHVIKVVVASLVHHSHLGWNNVAVIGLIHSHCESLLRGLHHHAKHLSLNLFHF